MSIEFKTKVAVLKDLCAVEEAEPLLQWLLDNPKGALNLKQIGHLHTSVIQVIMYLQPTISVMPENPKFRWLHDVLKP